MIPLDRIDWLWCTHTHTWWCSAAEFRHYRVCSYHARLHLGYSRELREICFWWGSPWGRPDGWGFSRRCSPTTFVYLQSKLISARVHGGTSNWKKLPWPRTPLPSTQETLTSKKGNLMSLSVGPYLPVAALLQRSEHLMRTRLPLLVCGANKPCRLAKSRVTVHRSSRSNQRLGEFPSGFMADA